MGSFIFCIGLSLQVLAIPALFVRISEFRHSNRLVHTLMIAGLGIALMSLFIHPAGSSILPSWAIPYFLDDSLSRFFLMIIQIAGIPIMLYSLDYCCHLESKSLPVKSLSLFIILSVLFTQLVVLANHLIVFLIVWEGMAVSSYLGMIYERQKKEVQENSFIYLILTHLSSLFLIIFGLGAYQSGHSWFFSDMHFSSFSWMLFITGFIGFAIKAGWMPVHFWLPRAHPVAPTMLSAFLSGVIIKMGIYGILRLLIIIPADIAWIGWLVLGLSLWTAIFGVWYALAQHDLKTLLAYHSVENIGIIGIGIALGMLGMAYQKPAMVALGLTGALLHTFNHAIFKSLLFIGAGVIYQQLGTKNIERLGGLIHQAPVFALLFLIGSVAICGLPPLNGFVSEFIIYLGFFETADTLKTYYPLLMLISTVGLAFIGGLAVACFTKINSIMFLGSSRSELPPLRVSVISLTAMAILALICILVGLVPQVLFPSIESIFPVFSLSALPVSFLQTIASLNIIFIFLLIAGAFSLWIKWYRSKKAGSRISRVWACGYRKLSPRMQYSASSFADALVNLAAGYLRIHKQVQAPKGIFPTPGSFESHSDDLAENKLAKPLYLKLLKLTRFGEWMNQTDIRYTIAFMLLTLVVYSLLAFIWMQ